MTTRFALPFEISQLDGKVPSPFYVYDEKGIRNTVREFQSAFSWCDYKMYFAVKALPNPHILKIMHQEGCGLDCSSQAELMLAQRLCLSGDEVILTSNNTPGEYFQKAKDLGAIVNLDDFSHIEFVEKSVGFFDSMCCRFNPGPEKTGNSIIGVPSEAKFGMTRTQLIEAYRILGKAGVSNLGLHTMVCSNELKAEYFEDTASLLFDVAKEIASETGVEVAFINLGGGVGIPHKPEEEPMDISNLGARVKSAYERSGIKWGPKILMECGRALTGPHGYLVSKVRHKKKIWKDYIGIDATMANLMRPGMYGAYHHITFHPERSGAAKKFDVVGSLCENNDKFAIDREIIEPEIGDYSVIHDCGAHGHSMGFNYNGKLRSAELLLKENGDFQMIRRAETYDDLFATLEF